MIYKLNISSIAESNISDAADWYYARGEELKTRFLDSVYNVITRIMESPFIYSPIHGKYRRALAKPFPYAVYFSINNDVINVASILHTSRSPNVVHKQLH